MNEIAERSDCVPYKAVTGRPLKYSNVQEVAGIIDQYFNDCKKNHVYYILNKEGAELPDNAITDDFRPTVTGLALALNMSRKQLIEYGDKGQFRNVIKAARARVESYLENRLYDSSPAGAIFNLKNNYGWRDEKHLSIENNEMQTINVILPPGSALADQLQQGQIIEHDADSAA